MRPLCAVGRWANWRSRDARSSSPFALARMRVRAVRYWGMLALVARRIPTVDAILKGVEREIEKLQGGAAG